MDRHPWEVGNYLIGIVFEIENANDSERAMVESKDYSNREC